MAHTLSKHTRNVSVNVNDTCVIGLVQSQRTKLGLGQVDAAQSDTLVNVSHQGVSDCI